MSSSSSSIDDETAKKRRRRTKRSRDIDLLKIDDNFVMLEVTDFSDAIEEIDDDAIDRRHHVAGNPKIENVPAENGVESTSCCSVFVVILLYLDHYVRSLWYWLFEMDSYRPILATTLWIANKISYQEDPTSYSTTTVRNDYVGKPYNYLFSNNRNLVDELGWRWFAYKWALIWINIFSFAFVFEYVFRRFVLVKLCNCWAFKRDKGSGFLFLVSLMFALYVSIVLFDYSIHRRYDERFDDDLNASSYVDYDRRRAYDDNDTSSRNVAIAITPWCSLSTHRFSKLKANYEEKLKTYEKASFPPSETKFDADSKTIDYLYAAYCRFGNSTLFESEPMLKSFVDSYHARTDAYDNLNAIVDDVETMRLKNACFKRLVRHFVKSDLPLDARFDYGEYCEYVWRMLIFEFPTAYDDMTINVTHVEAKSYSVLRNFTSDSTMVGISEGLFNRLAGLITDACDMITFFIILDEYMQKRHRKSRSAQLMANKHGSFLNRRESCSRTRDARCAHCSWKYIRIPLFWTLLVLEFAYLCVYASMSLNYVAYDHRCTRLDVLDFDDKNIAYNSFYKNTFDNADVFQIYAKHNVSFFGYDANVAPPYALTSQTTFHRFDTRTLRTFDNGTSILEDDDDDNCRSIWNDKLLFGMSKKHRILLAEFILTIELVLVLFSTDFPFFDGFNKIKRLKSKVESGLSQKFGNDPSLFLKDDEDESYVAFEETTNRYLSADSVFAKCYRVIFKKLLCYRYVDVEHQRQFSKMDDRLSLAYSNYQRDRQDTDYFVPGFNSKHLERISECCGNGPQERYDDAIVKKDDYGEYDDYDVVGDFETSEEYEEEEPGRFRCILTWFRKKNDAERSKKCARSCKKYTCVGLFGCFCFCCFNSSKSLRKKCYTHHCKTSIVFPYCRCEEDEHYRCKRKKKNAKPGKPFVTARWLMFVTLFLATFFNTTSLLQQCSFTPAAFDQIETKDGSVHQLRPSDMFDDENASSSASFDHVNLCLVCPTDIVYDENPYDTSNDVEKMVSKSPWRPVYETVEWVDVENVKYFGDIGTVLNTDDTHRRDDLNKCDRTFDDTLWDEKHAHCAFWNGRRRVEKSMDAKIRDKTCTLKKKMSYGCSFRGIYERLKNVEPTPFPYVETYDASKKTESSPFVYLTFKDPTDDYNQSEYRIDESFLQKDCNFYSDVHTRDSWFDSKRSHDNDSDYEKKDRWFYYDNPYDYDDKQRKKPGDHCLAMTVLEWYEINCNERRQNSDNDYDIYELAYLPEDVIMSQHRSCWNMILNDHRLPKYLSANDEENARDSFEWGFEYESTAYNFGKKKIWMGIVPESENARIPLDKSTLFMPVKTTVQCKISMCPIKMRNNQTDPIINKNDDDEDDDAFVLRAVGAIPLMIVVYMMWTFVLNIYIVKCLKNQADDVLYRIESYPNPKQRGSNRNYKRRCIHALLCLNCK